nr:DUF305 domain-containing protein [uncultured Dongia sp.]
MAVPAAATVALAATPAEAHVKWFAPYIVGAAPQPIGLTLANPWFWAGIVLVSVFFFATRILEKSSLGEVVLGRLDRITDPLWQRIDTFVRAVIAAFFIAIFAVGGVYLTPDLQTPAEWVSWTQLLIAVLIFIRPLQPLAAAGIIGLWLVALRDYDIFHLLDYLALGIGVAGYLVLEASSKPTWRAYRFDWLRWGVAIALMWSSLEKFAYPEWFTPLVVERPFLTFGMPESVFIPMAGVAEFTMGFGLFWTPLIRRLSAAALFIIFTSAVYPFGRVELIGHALIMMIIVAIVAEHSREVRFMPALKRSLGGIPVGLAGTLILFVAGYWGLHLALYGAGGAPDAQIAMADKSTHSPNPEAPHISEHQHDEAGVPMANTADEAYRQTMERMHGPMMDGMANPDPDMAFVLGMIPHHQGAIDMAKVVLRFGKDMENHELAKKIIAAQEHEIAEMRTWLAKRNLVAP